MDLDLRAMKEWFAAAPSLEKELRAARRGEKVFGLGGGAWRSGTGGWVVCWFRWRERRGKRIIFCRGGGEALDERQI